MTKTSVLSNKNVSLIGMAGALPFDCMYVGQRLQDS